MSLLVEAIEEMKTKKQGGVKITRLDEGHGRASGLLLLPRRPVSRKYALYPGWPQKRRLAGAV